jgi:hypothetical protein
MSITCRFVKMRSMSRAHLAKRPALDLGGHILTALISQFGSEPLPDAIQGRLVEPAGDGVVSTKRRCLTGEDDEDVPSDLLRHRGIANLSDSGGIDRADILARQGGKCVFAPGRKASRSAGGFPISSRLRATPFAMGVNLGDCRLGGSGLVAGGAAFPARGKLAFEFLLALWACPRLLVVG